ncbi:MAG: hypothetical protein Q8S17_02310 [Humidesulfovibrio sp.]|nr:hypothetical protein [Humidesulfovibrio sp.]
MRGHTDSCRPEVGRTDLHQAYALAFADEAGRLVLADLSRQGFLHETSFNPDPQRAAFNEGRRSLALYIGHMIAGPKPRRQAEPDAAGGSGSSGRPGRG